VIIPPVPESLRPDERDTAEAGPVRVLVVDDDEDQFVLIRGLLGKFPAPGFLIEWAQSYSSGLMVLNQRRHDVALVDYQLGFMDGIELIGEAAQAGVSTPMILVTGRGDRAVDLKAMAAGAIDYLPKADVTGPTLERSIRFAISNGRLLEALDRARWHVEALDDIGQILGNEGPTSAALDMVLGVVQERIGFGRSAIYLVVADRLQLGAARGFVDPARSIPADSGPLRRLIAEQRPLIVPPWTAPSAGAFDVSEWVAPMTFEDRVVGMLTVGLSARHGADDSEQQTLAEVATRVGSAIGLHQERTSHVERALALRRVVTFGRRILHEPAGVAFLDSILAQAGDVLAADGVALALPGGQGACVVAVARGSLIERLGRVVGDPHTPAERAIASGRVQVDSTGTSCAALAQVPLGDEPSGLLWIDRRGLDASYSPSECEALGMLGDEIGLAIEIKRRSATATRTGVRDGTTGLYSRPFIEALLSTLTATDAAAAEDLGLVLVTPRLGESLSRAHEETLLGAALAIAKQRAGSGPDLIAQFDERTIAVLVREQARLRTRSIAQALTDATGNEDGQFAVGWALRPSLDAPDLVAAAEMAVEQSRRARGEVEG
jgi:CheY-like chemotaxis protein